MIDEVSNFRLELSLKIKASFPKEVIASYVVISFPLPKMVSNVSNELGKNQLNQKVDIENKNDVKIVKWHIPKFKGETDQNLTTKITL